MSDGALKFPATYFGGKSKIAPLIWAALGNPKVYIEPFFGSGAVLLARPDWTPDMNEICCDADGLLCNVWRALQADPDAVAKVCDWPVNHADLIARRKVLIAAQAGLLERLCADDKAYDVELAGYWIWAASCWIGAGLTCPNARPHITNYGMGVHTKGKRPHIGHGGKGVHTMALTETPDMTADVRDPYKTTLWPWFRALSERLRYVRVVCGDWSRVCGGNWQDNRGGVGIFFDPPYSHDAGRDNDIYGVETDCAKDVAKWAHERGKLPSYRIVLAGYDGEHNWLEAEGWRVIAWKAHGGYSDGKNENRHRERLWCSPACIGKKQEDLFDV